MTLTPFTPLFLGFLLIKTLVELWLKVRHIQHIRRHQTRVPAAFAHTITVEQHQRAAIYSMDKAHTQIGIIIIEAMLLWGFTLGGGIEWLTRLTQAWFNNDKLSGITMIMGLFLLHYLVMLPISLYQTFVIEARHGFNKMGVGLYMMDRIKTGILSILIGFPLLWVVLTLMQQSDVWWLYAWVLWVGLSFILMALYPTVIAPLFNTFEPLKDNALKARVDALLKRCGFNSKGIL
jgi:STE24 endopeptidase